MIVHVCAGTHPHMYPGGRLIGIEQNERVKKINTIPTMKYKRLIQRHTRTPTFVAALQKPNYSPSVQGQMNR